MPKLKPSRVFRVLDETATENGWRLKNITKLSTAVLGCDGGVVVLTASNNGWRITPSYEKVPIWYGDPVKTDTLLKHVADRLNADTDYSKKVMLK
jgi:hypothetical protein